MTAAHEAVDHPIEVAWFIAYKFTNSLFLGLSIGTVFVLYTPLSPSVFSAGGIGLALATLLIATQYHRLFSARWFYQISMAVEMVILAGIVGVLTYPVNLELALFIYVGYQLTFAFGSYLVRCETLLIPSEQQLTRLDIAKQSGYLIGMGVAWAFYLLLETGWRITDKYDQVVLLHWPLLAVELAIIGLLWRSFRKPEPAN